MRQLYLQADTLSLHDVLWCIELVEFDFMLPATIYITLKTQFIFKYGIFYYVELGME